MIPKKKHPARQGRYPWEAWRERFVYKNEWPDLVTMHEALLEECKKDGKPAPTLHDFRNRAARLKWLKEKEQIGNVVKELALKNVIKKEVTRLTEYLEQKSTLGGNLQALGSNWIAEVEKAYAKALALAGGDPAKVHIPKAIGSFNEAVTAIRVGSHLKQTALEGILGKPGRDSQQQIPTEEIEDENDASDPGQDREDVISRISRIASIIEAPRNLSIPKT